VGGLPNLDQQRRNPPTFGADHLREGSDWYAAIGYDQQAKHQSVLTDGNGLWGGHAGIADGHAPGQRSCSEMGACSRGSTVKASRTVAPRVLLPVPELQHSVDYALVLPELGRIMVRRMVVMDHSTNIGGPRRVFMEFLPG